MNHHFQLLPDQASAYAPQLDALAGFLLLVTAAFTLIILVAVAYLALRYRRKTAEITAHPNPPDVPTNMKLEIAWTVIPLLIVMVIFVWGTKLYVSQSMAPANALEIHVIGKQWMWKIQHPDGRREINALTVPVGRPVKLVMTSQDVIHSFGIPAFRLTQDVLPGRYSYEWFQPTEPGTYHLFCREYCGTQHSGMIGEIRVLKAADYDRWLSGAPEQTESPDTAGAKLFQQFSCVICHSSRAPSLGGVYGSKVQVFVNGEKQTVLADENYLRESILYPRMKIAVAPDGNAYPSDLMPSYQGQMTEEQLMELVAYIKTLGVGGRPGVGGNQMDLGVRMQELNPQPPQLLVPQSGTGQR